MLKRFIGSKNKRLYIVLLVLVISFISIPSLLSQVPRKQKSFLKTLSPSLYLYYTLLKEELKDISFMPKKVEKKVAENKDFKKKSITSSEPILSAWHFIDKEVIDAKDYLSDYWDENLQGLPGAYIDLITENLVIGVNGQGKMFSFNVEKKTISPVDSNLNDIYMKQNFKGKIIPRLRGNFGVKDLFFDVSTNSLFISMSVDTSSGKGCYGIAIYRAMLSENIEKDINNNITYKKYFQTKECHSNYNGHASGGRIKRYKEDLILTVGDLDHGVNGIPSIPQKESNALGKVISISDDSTFKVLSMGHRNQQGLLVLDDTIIITEHGPQGGDEINIIFPNKQGLSHYGWPYYSYGFDYDNKDIFRHPHKGKYKKPLFYFTPSVATSEIIYYKEKEFPFWKNKFILGTLRKKSLYLLDYDRENNRIISAERINIGHRVRDIVILPSGKLLITSDDRNIILIGKSSKERSIESSKIDIE